MPDHESRTLPDEEKAKPTTIEPYEGVCNRQHYGRAASQPPNGLMKNAEFLRAGKMSERNAAALRALQQKSIFRGAGDLRD